MVFAGLLGGTTLFVLVVPKKSLTKCPQAGPEACPLAHSKGENPSSIEERIDHFLDQLYDSPLPVPFADRPGYLTAGGVRGGIY